MPGFQIKSEHLIRLLCSIKTPGDAARDAVVCSMAVFRIKVSARLAVSMMTPTAMTI
jgi:hypothetical protein